MVGILQAFDVLGFAGLDGTQTVPHPIQQALVGLGLAGFLFGRLAQHEAAPLELAVVPGERMRLAVETNIDPRATATRQLARLGLERVERKLAEQNGACDGSTVAFVREQVTRDAPTSGHVRVQADEIHPRVCDAQLVLCDRPANLVSAPAVP